MKRCKNCKEKFKPRYNTLQECCSPKCAIEWAKTKPGKDHVEKARKRETRQKKREFNESNLSWWMAVGNTEAGRHGGNTAYWLHRWVRLVRDKDKPCIMCGSYEPKGGIWDCCHFRTRGAAPNLRFNPDNMAKGCRHCNVMTTGDTGANFRANLVARIGEDRVKALETDNKPHKWTIDECRELRDHYRNLCKEAGV